MPRLKQSPKKRSKRVRKHHQKMRRLHAKKSGINRRSLARSRKRRALRGQGKRKRR